MAKTSSAKNANRTSITRNRINTKIKNEFKQARREFKKALDKKSKKKAQGLLSESYKKIDSAVKKRVLHKNTGARYKSRLAKALKKSE